MIYTFKLCVSGNNRKHPNESTVGFIVAYRKEDPILNIAHC